MNAPTRKRRSDSIAAEALFRARVAELGGEVLETEWLGAGTPHRVVCRFQHSCSPRPSDVARGWGICRLCAGRDPASGEATFRACVKELGGRVVGKYVNTLTPVNCVCALGHACRVWPGGVSNGQGMCRTCGGNDPEAAERAFRVRVEELGGRIAGQYVNNSTRVDVICANGHRCRPLPNSVQQGQGLCRACGGKDPAIAESAFLARVAELGGQVVGVYRGTNVPVECICPRGHACRTRPSGVRDGQGMCRRCSGRDSAVAGSAFRDHIARLGGQVVGQYINNRTPVECLCPAGHRCAALPGSVQQGGGFCRRCAGMEWDVLYVVTNPTLKRVKFGVTSRDERRRLRAHRRAGYSDAVRVIPGILDAAALERHVLATLRLAETLPVQGREYYDLSALPVILDIVDNWMATG